MALPESSNPFIGPLAFQRQEAKRFFGRDEEAEELLALVISEEVVLFYAQSGAGKTSLINARLIPDLEREGLCVLPVARVGGEETSAPATSNIYAFNALMYLAAADGDTPVPSTVSLAAYLAARGGDSATPRVLVIDQFEEILTAHPERWEEREGFFDQLRRALRQDPLLSVLLIMREDHIAGLDRYADLLPGGLQCRFRMERLRRHAALEAVRRPVETRRPFAPGVAERLVDNLRQEHLADQKKKIAGEFVEPVQLQVVCYQLWEALRDQPSEEITEQHLLSFGNIDRSLEDLYESAVAKVAAKTCESEARIRRWFDATLITPTRVRSQIYRGETKSGGLHNDAVQELVDAYLIRAEQIRGGTWFELVHDRFIDPILASNSKWFGQTRRRHLAFAAVAAACLMVLGLIWSRHQLREARLQKAEELTGEAIHTLEDDPRRSLWLAHQAAKMSYAIERRLTQRNQDVLRRALNESRARLIRRLPIGGEDHLLTLDRDGDRLSILTPDGGVSIFDVATGLELLLLPAYQTAKAAALTFDGTTLATALDDDTLQLWDVDSRQLHREIFTEVDVIELVFSPDGTRLAATTGEGTVEVWDTSTGDSVASLSDPSGLILVCAFDPQGRYLATSSDSGIVAIWDLDNGMLLHPFPGSDGNTVSFSLGGDLASAGFDGITVWEAEGDNFPGLWLHESSEVFSVAFRGDRYVAFALTDGGARIWDLETIHSQIALPGDTTLNIRPILSYDGRRLAVSSAEQTEVWELIFGETGFLSGHVGRINALAVSSSGGLLASGSDDHTARLWGLGSGELLATLRGHSAPVNGVAFSPDRLRLATASDDRTARIWKIDSGRQEQILRGHSNTVTDVAWNPDGTLIATASTDGTARLWLAEDGGLRSILPHPDENVLAVAFSPDGTLLATAGGVVGTEAGRSRLWDVRSGTELARLVDHTDLVNTITFSPDGELLATGSDDHTARIWDVSSATLRQELSGHSGLVLGVAFAPDGRRLATCDVTQRVRLWDVESGEVSFTIPGPSEIYDVAFTSDGQQLVTGSSDAGIRLEPLTAEELIRQAEERTGIEPRLRVEN